MRLLPRAKLLDSIRSTAEERIYLQPLLSETQVNAISIDLRIGTEFCVSVLTRQPAIILRESEQRRGVGSFFQETRRDLGDAFVMYPGQLVLAVTLEYVSLPRNVCCDIVQRSSIGRLGLTIGGMIQPGFRGCLPLELFNHGSTPVELVVGSRICQARFYEVEGDDEYLTSQGAPRKYFASVRPVVSRADKDEDLPKLKRYPGHLD